MTEPTTTPPSDRDKYAHVLEALFTAALNASGFDTVCALLRVGGMADANWDAFDESRIAFDDYNWMLEKVSAERGVTAARRVALLMYCQAVEMTGAQEMMANLLRCTLKRPYVVDPFADLWLRKKKSALFAIPPSATKKYRRVKELAVEASRQDVADAVDAFFDDRIRNAFSHSDYIITETSFRFTEKGIPQQIPVATLDEIIQRAFAFFGALLYQHQRWLRRLGKSKRYHRMPNYEVLELLTDEAADLHGFRVHFSNGNSATYARRPSGVEATNLVFERDGSINFTVGPLDALEPQWKIDGK